MPHESPPRKPTDDEILSAMGLPPEEYQAAKKELERRRNLSNDPDMQNAWYNEDMAREIQSQSTGPDRLDKFIAKMKGFLGGKKG